MNIPEFKETMLEVFLSQPDIGRMGFLSSFFKTKPEYFTNGEKIDIDVVKRTIKVAPVVTPKNTGAVNISQEGFTSKQVTPPLYAMTAPVEVAQLMKRKPGETVFDKNYASWTAEMQKTLMPSFELMQSMIRVSIENQASQMLQTGKVDLTDKDGNTAYELDYGMAASHKITPTTKWDQSGADPIADLKGAMKQVRDDGYVDVTTAIFGTKAWESFIADENVLKLFQKDVLNIAALNPSLQNKGAEYMGYIMIGAYKLNLLCYSATWEPFNTSNRRPFIDDDKVILLPDVDSLDFRLVYANTPVIPTGSIFDDIIPNDIIVENRIRYGQRVWHDQRADAFFAEVKSRPLCLPVSIDRFAVLSGTVTA